MQDYKIKQAPEEFMVKERSSLNIKKTSGPYAIFNLKKRNYNTETACEHIASALHIERKNIGYAGNKDSTAITEQMISIRGLFGKKAESLHLKDLSIEPLGFLDEPIHLGDLEGNDFEIIIRNITDSPKEIGRIINYYGEQRFSTDNASIGKAIIKKDFKRATELLLTHNNKQEEKVAEALLRSKNDYVGAIKRLPWKTLQFYIHAYQSKLWNETASEYARDAKPDKNIKIPIIGFATESSDELLNQIIDKILENEAVTRQDFIIRAIPDLSSAGAERDLFVEIKDLSIGKLEDDELNQGMKKVLVKFSLSKGSYATEAIKEMFSE